MPTQPLPATYERLQAFIQAKRAFYGSLLIGLLSHHLNSECAESVGAAQGAEFDVLKQGWSAFDVDGKGYINAHDLRRVCRQMGYKVSDRDVRNMIHVMSPTAAIADEQLGSGTEGAPQQGAGGPSSSAGMPPREESGTPKEAGPGTISFDRYKTTMQASLMRRYDAGQTIFKDGDPVDAFYVITRGSCEVLVAGAEGGGSEPRVIAALGPGDFFGETGLLEGRKTRNASVVCTSPTEVMMVDEAVFTEIAGKGEKGNKLSETMRKKADKRQRARLMKVLEPMMVSVQQRREYRKGQVVFRQGDPADHFFIVNAGELEMSVTTPQGQPVRVKRLHAGDHFGYDALLSDRHDTTVTCLGPVELTAVPESELKLVNDQYLKSTFDARKVDRDKEADMRGARHGGADLSKEAQILPMMARAFRGAEGGDRHTEGMEQYEAMLAGMQVERYSDQQVVFEQGSKPEAVYIVTSGVVQCEYDPSLASGPSRSSTSASSAADRGVTYDGRDIPAAPSAPPSAAAVSVVRVVATLGSGDHFGETAVLEGRDHRNLTVRCVAPECELRAMRVAKFQEVLGRDLQLSQSVRMAAEARTYLRIRGVIEEAVAAGQASVTELAPGGVLFRQGDRSSAFYLVESGEVEMSLVPDAPATLADGACNPSRRSLQP